MHRGTIYLQSELAVPPDYREDGMLTTHEEMMCSQVCIVDEFLERVSVFCQSRWYSSIRSTQYASTVAWAISPPRRDE